MQDSQSLRDLSRWETEDVEMIYRSFESHLPHHIEYPAQHDSLVSALLTPDQQVETMDALFQRSGQAAAVESTTLMSGEIQENTAQSSNHSRVAFVGPSSEDWEIHRPIIEQLYIMEDVRLKDVRVIMEERFDFVAR